MDKIAYCGDDCRFCLSYIGTIKKDKKILEKMAKILHCIGWREKELPAEEIKCYGCHSRIWCEYGIKQCCEEKHVDNCGYCQEYPCSKNKIAFDKNEIDIKRCEIILSTEDFEMFKKAFFSKKENLKEMKK